MMHDDREDVDGDLQVLSDGEGGRDTERPATPRRRRRYRNELSAEEREEDAPAAKRYQVRWEELPVFRGWLKSVKNEPLKARCSACGVNLNCGKSELEKHAKSAKHQKAMKSVRGTPSIESSLTQVSTSTKLKRDVKEAEIALAAAFAEHNVAISAVEHFVPVLQKVAKDSKIMQGVKLGRTKCTALIKNVVAKFETDELVENIKQVPFSVLIDGSTDHSAHKNMCVIVKYTHPSSGLIRTELLELVDLDPKDCTAEPQFLALKKCLEDKGVPMENIVGLGCDNENTMTGEHNSVWSRLRAQVPHCMLMGCTCHSAASTASAACKALPDHLEQLITKIVNYVAGSPKRIGQLKEFQEYFEAEDHKLLKLCTTRWLSRHQCIVRILEQWEVLQQYFNVASFEEASFPQHKKKPATEILHEVKNPYNKAYYLFLDYALNFFNQFNALFQSKKVLIHRLRNESVQLLKDIAQNYLLPESVDRIFSVKLDDPRLYVPEQEVYLGPKCEEYIKNCPQQYQAGFSVLRKKCLDFYVAGASDMRRRLPALNDPVLEEVKFVDMAIATSSASRRELRDLAALGQRYKGLQDLNLEKLAWEWRTMPNAFKDSEKKRLQAKEPDEAWAEISNMKTLDGQERFPELSKLARCVLALPHSNADCERIFTIVTDVRGCKKRNKIGSGSMNAICVTRSCFKSKNINCTSFKITQKHIDLHTQEMYGHIAAAKETATSAN